MTFGDRVKARLATLGKKQAWLARQVGLHQSTINGIIKNGQRSSTHIVAIARALQTTPEYLLGETNDPDAGAPPEPPASPYQAITMQVLLPAEDALARMFEALLSMVDPETSIEEQARLLAKNLPVGLSQLRDLLPSAVPAARAADRQPRSKTLVEPR